MDLFRRLFGSLLAFVYRCFDLVVINGYLSGLSSVAKFPTRDPDHRILRKQRCRFTHYYFYLRDEVLGRMVIRVASFLPFQATYSRPAHPGGRP